MSRLPAAFDEVVDATGQPVSGGKRYTYAAGTTTEVATYPTRADLAAETNANANPLVADAAGQLGAMFIADGVEIKIVDKTAADVTLRTIDNFTVPLDSSASLVTRVKQIASNPLDYDALGDGVADESAEVQEAIDGATTNGVVDLLGLVFRCDSAITLRDGITLRNGTLDFTNCTADEFIKAHGTLGSEILLTSDGTYAAGSVALASVSGLATGDLLVLYDTQDYIDAINRGELKEIAGITSLTVSTLGGLLDAYATASSAAVKEVSTVDDVTLDNLTVIGADISGTHAMVSLVNTRRCKILNCHFSVPDTYAIELAGAFDTLISGCAISYNAISGIIVADASQHTKIRDCVFSGLNIGVTVGTAAAHKAAAAPGIPRFTTIEGCEFSYGGDTTTPQISVHENAEHVTVVGGRIRSTGSDAADSISVACANATIEGVDIFRDGTGTPDAIQLSVKVPNRSGRNYSLRVRNNRITTDGLGVVYTGQSVTGGSGALTFLEIVGNVGACASGQDFVAVAVGSAATVPAVTKAVISGNKASVGDITVSSSHASATLALLEAVDNNCDALSITGTTTSVTTAYLRDGIMAGATTIGTGVVNARIQGGTFTTITLDELTTIAITGLVASGKVEIDNTDTAFTRCQLVNLTCVGGADTHALEVDASASGRSAALQIVGGYFSGVTGNDHNPINITGLIDGVVITGLYCSRDDDNDPCIDLAGDAASGIAQIMITNVVGVNGDYVIGFNNTASWYTGFVQGIGITTAIVSSVLNGDYTVTNLVTDRALDCDANDDLATADVLGTLLSDLAIRGILL